MKFLVGKNWRNPEKILSRLLFVHHGTHIKRHDDGDGNDDNDDGNDDNDNSKIIYYILYV